MEKVYGCGDLDYTSEPICLRDFFNDASLQQPPFVNGPIVCTGSGNAQKDKQNVERERMMEMMDSTLTDSEFLDLESICSASNFKIRGVQPPCLDIDDFHKRSGMFEPVRIPQDSDLETHHKLRSRNRIHERFLKYVSTIWLEKMVSTSGDSNVPDNVNNADLVPGNELVAVVRVYAPFKHEIGKKNHRIAAGCQEIVILGSQSLADLRDRFSCSSDDIICQDLSENPFRKTVNLAKNTYKSGMMYIGETFYNDMRYPSNVDYSEVVMAWARQRDLYLGKKQKMEETKIFDLTVKLGYPYLYQHQGNCEHLFCFSDIRLLHQSDPLQLSKYPLLKSICKQQSRYCMLCGHYVAKWLTVGNTRVPHDPCYFCQACFLSYNYINKKKIGDFAAYPFSETSPELIANSN